MGEKRKKKHNTIRRVDLRKHSTGHLVFPKASQNCIFFCRTGEIEEEAIAHEGSKGARAIYLKNELVFTTGRSFSVFYLSLSPPPMREQGSPGNLPQERARIHHRQISLCLLRYFQG